MRIPVPSGHRGAPSASHPVGEPFSECLADGRGGFGEVRFGADPVPVVRVGSGQIDVHLQLRLGAGRPRENSARLAEVELDEIGLPEVPGPRVLSGREVALLHSST